MKELELQLNHIVKMLRVENTRWDAILELKLLNDPELVVPLVRLLEDRDWVVRWCVAEKLGEMKAPTAIPSLTRLLMDRDFHVRKNAVKALVKFGPEVCAYLVTQFSHPHFSVRRHISLIISHFGAKSVPFLVKDFALRDWVSANRIVHAVFEIPMEDKEEILLDLIANGDVQKPLVIMMGQLKVAKAVPHLIRLYKNPRLRRCILESLRRVGEKQSLPLLVVALRKGSPQLRALAEQIILKIGKPMLSYLVKGLLESNAPTEKLLYLIEIIGPESIMPSVHRLALRNPEFLAITKSLLAKYPYQKATRRNPIGGIFNILGDIGDSLLSR
jgi:HEAT repeat protein